MERTVSASDKNARNLTVGQRAASALGEPGRLQARKERIEMRVTTRTSDLAVTAAGQGEPVLFIHGGFFGGVFEPMCQGPLVRDGYRVIAYDRHGYRNSSKPTEPLTVKDIVDDALTVLREAGGDRGHIVAHSAGGPYGLQLAMDHPEAVQTLTLIEPVLPTQAWGAFLAQNFAPAGEALQQGDTRRTLDLSFGPVYGGTHYPTEIDPYMPEGWQEQAEADIGNLFVFESPALGDFSFGPDEATRIQQPVLLMRGSDTEPIWITNHEQAKEWIPRAEEHIVPGGNHMCPVMHQEETARALSSFFAAHPIGDAVPQ